MAGECLREPETMSAVVSGRWPDGCDESLRAHVAECETCAGLVELLTLLRAEQDDLQRHVSVPSAGQVWWRAAVRARLENTHTAARPLSWLSGIVGAFAVGLTIALVSLLWPPVAGALAWIAERAWTPALSLGEWSTVVAGTARVSGLLLLGGAAFLVLAPLALYFVLSDE